MPQDVAYLVRLAPFGEYGQRNGLFNRLIGALSEVWKHRMGGISEDRKTPFGP